MSEVIRRNVQENNNTSARNGEPVQNRNDSALKIIWDHLLENRLELFHQLVRILSIWLSFFCFLSAVQAGGQWSTRVSRYQKALLAGGSGFALSMHAAVENIPESGLLSMDALHFLIYSYILCTGQPSLVALIPLCVWSILDLSDFLFNLLSPKVSPRHALLQLTSWIRANRDILLQMSAYVEIFIGVLIIPWVFVLDINFVVLAYYKFLQFRYQSRSPYSRIAFRKCRLLLESVSQQRQCPEKVRELIDKIIDAVSRMAPSNSDFVIVNQGGDAEGDTGVHLH